MQIQTGEKVWRTGYEIRRVEVVGPKVGIDLSRKALLGSPFFHNYDGNLYRCSLRAAVWCCCGIALFHDVLISVGALSLAGMEFDLTVVVHSAALVGFSVNDTVIVCDRINLRKLRRESLAVIINRSINETLSRTIITNSMPIVVVMTLLFLGGDVIHAFAFVMLVGFISHLFVNLCS